MDRRSSNLSRRGIASVAGLVIVLTALAVGAFRLATAGGTTPPRASGTVTPRAADAKATGSKHPVANGSGAPVRPTTSGGGETPGSGSTTASTAQSASSSGGHPPSTAAPSSGPSRAPTPTPSPVTAGTSPSPHPTPSHTNSAPHTEEEWHTGANTFNDPSNASGLGPKIAPAQRVLVSCKLYDPSIASASPGGYWYRISSPPWNNQYYAVANTFLNGDPWDGPYTHPTDFSIPNC